MYKLIFELAAIAALGASAFAAAVMFWQGASIWTIAFRTPIAGGLVFFFVLVGGHLLGRSVLAEIARVELERRQREEEERARRAEAEAAEDEDRIREAIGMAESQNRSDDMSSEKAA